MDPSLENTALHGLSSEAGNFLFAEQWRQSTVHCGPGTEAEHDRGHVASGPRQRMSDHRHADQLGRIGKGWWK